MFKKIAFVTVTILLSFLFFLLLIELTLRTGLFDNADNPHPVWIPHKYQKIHDEIEHKNWQYAKLNPYKFTDRIRSEEKPEGVKRIAVLGDSFIWGTGIPYDQTWSHKLEEMVNKKYNNYEVLSWGFPSWSTMDELSFLENHGVNYNIDTLIVGYVNNDPHIQRIELKVFSWHKSAVAKVLKVIFPNAISFIRSYLYNFLFKYFDDYGYSNWVLKLHSKENLKEYANVLKDFSLLCHSKKIKLLFALTPSNHEDIYREHFDLVTPLLKEADIEYIDLYTPAKKEYGHINSRELWANPADAHPGPLLTDLFARHVFDYMEMQGVFSTSQGPEVQPAISMSPHSHEDSTIVSSLIDTALTHSSGEIRREAVEAIAKLNPPGILKKLTIALLRGDHKVREAAAYALGEINNPSSADPLIKALHDKTPGVRKSVILALEKKDAHQIIDPLITAATQDKNKYVRRLALLALTKFKDGDTVDALIESLKDEFFYNRKTSAIALGKSHDPRCVEPLIKALSDEFTEVRLAVVEALGEIQDPRAVDRLKVVSLKDDDPLVRDHAALAVKKITGKEYGKYRRKLLRMWQEL